MTARGVHFALTAEDQRRLLDRPAEQRPDLIADDIEEAYFEQTEAWVCETDKAWDAIHRAFSPSELDYKYQTPLNGVILGGEPLYFGDDYIISLKRGDRVREIAGALRTVTAASFRSLYFAIDPVKYAFGLSDEDFEYSWGWLQEVAPFYGRSAEAGRSVIFTTDQ